MLARTSGQEKAGRGEGCRSQRGRQGLCGSGQAGPSWSRWQVSGASAGAGRWIFMMVLVSRPGSPDGWLCRAGVCAGPYFLGAGWACAGKLPTSNPVLPPAHCCCRATCPEGRSSQGVVSSQGVGLPRGACTRRLDSLPSCSASRTCQLWHSTQRCPSVPGITAIRWHSACPLAGEPGGSPIMKQAKTVELLVQAEKK